MSRYADKACPVCKGEGAVFHREEEKYEVCACTYKAMVVDLLRAINPELTHCGKEELDPAPIMAWDAKNLVFIGSYHAVLRRVRVYLIRKLLEAKLSFYCKFLSDLQMLEMWLGQKSKEEEDSDLSFSSILSSPQLLFLIGGHKSSKNVALSGVFLEALKTRSLCNKPVWVYLPHQLRTSDFYYSAGMESYLESFTTISLQATDTNSFIKVPQVMTSKSSGLASDMFNIKL
jgi:hypothetical protein